MDKKIFESHASFLTEFVRKVKNKETSVFRMSYVASSAYTFHYQFVKVPVGKDGCSYIYGAYDKCEEALTHFELPFKVYAIVNEENIFFTMYVSTFGLAYWSDDEWHQFNEMAEIKGHYFPAWCKRFQETFTSSVLAPVYESLTDLPELSEDDKDECLEGAREYMVYESCKLLDDFNFPPASREILGQLLCGVNEPFLAYRDHCTKDLAGSMRKHKAMRNHTLSLIETHAGFAPWELDMAGALKDMNPDSRLMVTFSYDGKVDSARMKVSEVRKSLWRRSGIFFHDSSFYSRKEGYEVTKALTGFRDRLAPKHIAKIVYGTKILYERVV